MEKNASNFFFQPLFRPVRMLVAQAGQLQSSSGPIEVFSLLKPLDAGHGSKNLNLLRAGLFIGQHSGTLRQDCLSGKRKESLAQAGVVSVYV
jgi:hypothetical protein